MASNACSCEELQANSFAFKFYRRLLIGSDSVEREGENLESYFTVPRNHLTSGTSLHGGHSMMPWTLSGLGCTPPSIDDLAEECDRGHFE